MSGLEKSCSAGKGKSLFLQILFLVTGGMVLIGGIILKVLDLPGRPAWLLQLDLWKSAFFLFCAAVLYFIGSSQRRWLALGVLILAELGISGFFNQDSNLYLHYPTATFTDQIDTPEDRFHSIDLDQPVGKYQDNDFRMAPLQRNTGTLTKNMVRDGYWPWTPRLQAENKNTRRRKEQLRYPLFYLSRDTTGRNLPNYTNFKDEIVIRSQTDHQWELSFLNHYEKFLILNQNFNKNWIAYIDHQRVPIAPTRSGMMKIPVKPGLHTATFTYRTDGTLHVFVVTMVVFLILIIFMIKSGSFPLTALALCFPVLVVFAMNSVKSTPKAPKLTEQKTATDSADYVMNYEGIGSFWFLRPEQITPFHSYDGYRSESFDESAEFSATLQVHRDALKGKNVLEYQFQIMASEAVDLAIVVKTYSRDDESYNIRYMSSLHTGEWSTLKGQFPLQKLQGPLVKTKFYLWNYKKQDFLIDDIEIKLSP